MSDNGEQKLTQKEKNKNVDIRNGQQELIEKRNINTDTNVFICSLWKHACRNVNLFYRTVLEELIIT